MFIPVICQARTVQPAAASTSVASAAAGAVLGRPGALAASPDIPVRFAVSSVMTSCSPFSLCFCVRGFGEPLDRCQSPVPLGGEAGHGLGGLVQAAGLQLVEDLPALLAPADQPGAFETGQALRVG